MMGKMELGLFVSLVIWGICDAATNTSLGCTERERAALLSFKATLFNPAFSNNNGLLVSWNSINGDCCSWEGVACHKTTGHVISLDLTRGNKPYEDSLEAIRFDSWLLELKHLTYLDLSSIYFGYSKFPAYLGSLKQLQYLNLSHTYFSGVVPQNLGNLSSLRTLDLSNGYFLEVGDLMWASRLPSLEHLDLNNVNLSMATHVFEYLSNLSSLRTLDLSWAALKVDDLMWLTRLSSLEHLDLSGVIGLSRTTHVFEVLNTLPSLLFLSLSESGLDNTHLPAVSSIYYHSTFLANLQHLDLSLNSFHGEFPCFLPNMTSLTFLDLSYNMFNLSLSGTHLLGLKTLTHLNLAYINIKVDWSSELLRDKVQLKSLDLHGNGINGDILGVFKNFSSHKIESLNLMGNNFYGELPEEVGELNYLTNLDLSDNHLNGRIPTSLGNLSHLESFDISRNCFETTFSEAHFAKLSNLEEFGADNNKIRFDVGYDWVPPFQLRELWLRSTKMGGQFPEWLQTQKALKFLDLSKCSITGSLPAWLRSMNSLHIIDVSHNNISGTIPEFSSNMTVLQLSDNRITHLPSNIAHIMRFVGYLNLARNMINGSLPDSLCRMEFLSFLDLSKNHFSGNLPNCWPSGLQVASLSYNQLTGVIPNSIGGASSLLRLHLNDNTLTGQLPSTLNNCTFLAFLDVGGNNLSGKIPKWIGNDMTHLKFLRLRKNDFSGSIPRELCQLSHLQVMDLANNNLTANIPHCFSDFSGMMSNGKGGDSGILIYGEYSMDSDSDSLSEVMKGVELEYTTNYKYLLNLDLSCNHLVGQIPWELTNLSSLLGLNLSYNHLEGEIPANIGDMKSLESLDLSNNHLVGEIPQSLSNLNFLSHLNLSNNDLSGHIPDGRQLQTLEDPSIYQGNPLLCGSPFQRKCDESPHVQHHEEEEEDEDRADKIWFYGIITAGFATGFWAAIGVMVVKTKLRQAYFRYIEVAMAKMLRY